MDVKKLSVVVEQKGIAPTAKNLERLAKASESASPQLERLSSSLGSLKGIDLSPFTGKLASALDTIKDIKVSTKGLADIAKDVGGLSVNLSNIANATDRLAGRVADLSAYATQLHAIRVDLEGMKGLSSALSGIKIGGLTGGGSGATASVDAEIKAQQRLLTQIERTAMMAGKTKAEYLELRAAQAGITSAAAPYIAKLKEADTVTGKLGMTTKGYNAAMRMVPAQFTDVAVQLAGGQNPMLVLLQQGGQLKDVFGGVGNAAKAVAATLFSVTGIATMVAGALGGITYAAYLGSQEFEDYNRELLLTNKTHASTASSIADLAGKIETSTGATKGSVIELMNSISLGGKVSESMLGKVAEAAINLERAGGQAASKTAEEFASLGTKPVDAVVKLDEKYNFLTASVYKQIESLEKQGDHTKAIIVAQEAFFEALSTRTPGAEANLGSIERGIRKIKDMALSTVDAMKGIGRKETVESLQTKIATLEKNPSKVTGVSRLDQLKQELSVMLQQRDSEDENALIRRAADEDRKKALKTETDTSALRKTYLSDEKKLEEELKKIRESNLTITEKASAVEQATAKYTKTTAGTKNDLQQAYAAKIAAEKDYSETQIKLVKNRLAQEEITEDQSAKDILAIQEKSFDKRIALLKDQLNKTKDVGEKSKINQQIKSLGTDAEVAAEAYTTSLAKISQVRKKYMQEQAMLSDNATYKVEQENVALREQIDVLGLTDKQLGAYQETKQAAIAASERLAAANLLEAASSMEAGLSSEAAATYTEEETKAIQEAIPYYKKLAESREAVADALDKKAMLEYEKGMKKAAVDSAAEWKKTADKIGDSITDALMRGFESGKTFAENLRDATVNMFNTMVLKPVIQATVMGGLSALGMGSATAADGTSSMGGLGNLASLGNSAYNAYAGGGLYTEFATSGVGQALGLSSLAANPTTTYGISAAANTMTGTAGMSSIGSTVGGESVAGMTSFGSALPYVGLAAAAAALLSSAFGSGGTPHSGGITFSTPTGTVTPNTAAGIDSVYKDAAGNRLGDQFAENDWTESFSKSVADSLTPTAQTINSILNSAATTFGKKAGYTTGLAFSSDGEDDSRGRLGIVDGAGIEVAQIMGRYSSDAATGIQELIGAAGGSVRQALDAMNLPAWANNMLSALGASPSVDSLAATVTQINAIATAAKTLAPAFKMAEDDFAKVYLKAGSDAVNAYYNATTTSAEKQAAQLNQITDAFGALGYSLPESIESFRALAESQDSTTAAGQNTIASLMGLTAGFAAFRTSVDGLQSSASNAIDAFRTPEQSIALKQSALSDLSSQAGIAVPTSGSELVALFDSIDFAKPTKEGLALASALPGIASAFSALETALGSTSASAKAIAEERKALQDQIDSLTMTTTQLREKELSALDASNRSLQERIYALNDAAAAETAAAEVTERIAAERKGLQDQIDSLTMSTTELRQKELSTLDVSNRGLQERIYKLNDEASALEQYNTNIGIITSSSLELVDAAYSKLERSVAAQKKLADASYESKKKEIEASYEGKKQELEASVKAATEVSSTLTSLIDTLSRAERSLVVESSALSLARRKAAQETLNAATAASRSGGSLAAYANAIDNAIADLSEPAEDLYASFEDYARSQGRANASLSQLSKAAQAQKSVSEQLLNAVQSSSEQLLRATQSSSEQLERAYASEIATLDQTLLTAQEQINVLKGIDTSVVGVGDAMLALSEAVRKATAIKENVTPTATATTEDIVSNYQNVLGRAPDASGLAYWQGRAAAGATAGQIKHEFVNSAEAKINTLYETLLGRKSDEEGLAFWRARVYAGESLSQVEYEFKNSPEYKAIHGFANGGVHTGGLRIVGENGPELEATGPSRIYNAGKTKDLLSSGSNKLESLVERLISDNERISAELRAIAGHANKTAKILERVTPDGDAIATKEVV